MGTIYGPRFNAWSAGHLFQGSSEYLLPLFATPQPFDRLRLCDKLSTPSIADEPRRGITANKRFALRGSMNRKIQHEASFGE